MANFSYSSISSRESRGRGRDSDFMDIALTESGGRLVGGEDEQC
jgi:hypothetical protein